jgi:hypothetical protein
VTEQGRLHFNPPPGWPKPPDGWIPSKDWTADPSWPLPPLGWQLWLPESGANADNSASHPVGLPSRCNGDSLDSAVARSGADVHQRISLLQAENAALRKHLSAVGTDPNMVVVLDDERVLQEVGIYRYHHPLENAVGYKDRLGNIMARIAAMAKANGAIEKSNLFTFNGSLSQGRRMTNDLAKLMLRAYNSEADNALRSLRAGNVQIATGRLQKSREAIANLGKMMEMRISDAFHGLRIEEIELTADYLMKKQEEREADREERERLREERKVEIELAAERDRLNKERSHIVTVLERLQVSGSVDPALVLKLAEIEGAIAQNDYRAANIRAGYVYVISNRGAFGANIVKIGLTRRLEPLDRINELGDASVPFHYDVHALYFSADAITLESDLHKHFADHRVNWVNLRREFFFATPAEVRAVLAEKVGNLLEFTEHVESNEYLQSVKYWPSTERPSSSIAA